MTDSDNYMKEEVKNLFSVFENALLRVDSYKISLYFICLHLQVGEDCFDQVIVNTQI